MVLTDTHCHLCHSDYESDWSEVVSCAESVGIAWLLNVGFDVPSSRKALEQAAQINAAPTGLRMGVSVGVHPHDSVDFAGGATVAELRNMLNDEVVAIGETGLDFYRDYAPVQQQERAFRSHVRLARELSLPLVIHNRDSVSRLLEILDEEGNLPAVFHCFSGTTTDLEMVIERGYYVGFTGNITYPKAANLRELVAAVPMERLLIETDSPWLSPQLHRGKRNQPLHVRSVAEAVAQIRGLTVEEVGGLTTRNAHHLFGTPPQPEGAESPIATD